MPSEDIGACGDAQWPDCQAITVELEFGIACLRRHCGPEPGSSSLEVVWHDHDSGSYATISLVWERGELFDEHWEYIERCIETLGQLDACVDWEALHALRATNASPPAVKPKGRRASRRRRIFRRIAARSPRPARPRR